MFNKILTLSPHTDDGELGAGGSISRFIDEGKDVYYVAFSSCEKSVPMGNPKNILKTECEKATKLLGIPRNNLVLMDYEVRVFAQHRQAILDDMIKLNRDIKPDLILIPSSNDIHQDHQVIHMEALRAFKKTSSIWGYEHPWNNLSFTTDIFVKLSDKNIKRKLEALKQYTSQDFREYMTEDYIRDLAHTRGAQVGIPLAETFELLRLFLI